METTLEIERGLEINIALPPSDQVHSYLLRSLDDPQAAVVSTRGGIVSYLISFLLACFPQLYRLDKIKSQVTERRGVTSAKKGEARWGNSSERLEGMQVLRVLKTCLALMYYAIKHPSKPPTTQVTSRFNAMYLEIHKTGVVPAVPIDMSLAYAEAASWLATQVGLPRLLTALIELREAETCRETGKVMLN